LRKGRSDIRALSICQPWAHAVLHLGKDVENRPWRTHFRGTLLIQASLKVERNEALKLKFDPDSLPTDVIVGSVEVVDCVRGAKSRWATRGLWHRRSKALGRYLREETSAVGRARLGSPRFDCLLKLRGLTVLDNLAFGLSNA
jgi:hypothetical protein